MTYTIREEYLESEILSAEPIQLVGILYRAAIDAIRAARVHVWKGEIRERSRCITKASEIINRLMLSVDRSSGGEISHNLVELYAYMQSRLIEANTKQVEGPLSEVQGLLSELLEAWSAAANGISTQIAIQQDYEPLSCTY